MAYATTAAGQTQDAKGNSFANMIPFLHTAAALGFMGQRASGIISKMNAFDPLVKQASGKYIADHAVEMMSGNGGEGFADAKTAFMGVLDKTRQALGDRKEAVAEVVGKSLSDTHKQRLREFGDRLHAAVSPHIERVAAAAKNSSTLKTAIDVATAAVRGKPGGNANTTEQTPAANPITTAEQIFRRAGVTGGVDAPLPTAANDKVQELKPAADKTAQR